MIHPLPKVEFTQLHLKHPNIEPGTHLSIAQVTDIHIGPWVKPRHVEQLVEHVNHLNPDLVALTGDYVGYRKKTLEYCAHMFEGFVSPTYAVLGNHDHWADTRLAQQAFERSSVDLLTNEARVFDHVNGSIRIVGVDDAVTKNHDIEAAHRDHEEQGFTLTLNHVPEVAATCAEFGSDVILSGHTHGLQFNIPKVAERLAKLAKLEFTGGYYPLGPSHLYVCRGIGSASWPRRIDATPEVAVITLEHGESEATVTGTRVVRLAR